MNDKLYGRCFVPHYCLMNNGHLMDIAYAPWILLHIDRKKLTDEVLMEEWRHFYTIEKEEEDVLDAFYDMLKQKGYMIVHMEGPILVLDLT